MKKVFGYICAHKQLFILLLIITASAICQLYQINRDFDGLWEYDAAQNQLYSMNLLKYGLSSRLGPVSNVNPLNDKFTYYLYHPFLSVYVLALFFKIFGSTIVVGRLVAMFFFGLATASLYVLVSRLWSRNLALWSCFFFAFFPTSQYFFRFVGGGGSQLLIFAFAFVYYYDQWLRDGKPSHFRLLAISYLLGCAIDWEAIFLAPVAVIHYRYFLKNKGRQIFALLLAGAFCVAAFLGINYFLTGSFSAIQPQWPANFHNINGLAENESFIKHLMIRMDFSLLTQRSFYLIILDHLLNAFTWPPLIMVLYFFFNYQTFKYFSRPAIYILFLASLYLGYGLVHPETLSGHITLTPYLSASFAIICALVIIDRPKLVQYSFAALFIIFSFFGTQRLYSRNDTWPTHVEIGKVISVFSSPNDNILLTEPFFSPYIEYRGERKILYDAYTWERMNYAIGSGKIKYFITAYSDYQGYLISRFPSIILPANEQHVGYCNILFDVQAKGLVPPRRRKNIAFDDNLRLIDFSAKRLPYGMLLLEYGWEKSGPVNKQDMVFVHLESENNPTLGQDHYIQRGLIDLTGPGERLIKESYIIQLPEYAQKNKLSVYLGLYPAGTQSKINVLNYPAKNNRVYLGNI